MGQAILQVSQFNEKCTAELEQDRAEIKSLQSSLRSASDKMESLMERIFRMENDCKSEIVRERTFREDQSKSTSSAIRIYAQEIQALDKLFTQIISKEPAEKDSPSQLGTNPPKTLTERVNLALADPTIKNESEKEKNDASASRGRA